jgi:uncharacterized protein YcfJ
MKKALLLTGLALTASAGFAQELGRVISSTPVVQQYGTPRQVCSTEQVVGSAQPSGAGALMGAVAGGAMGNAVGDGGGRAVATMIGIVGGAILGNRIEGGGQPQVQQVQNCTTQTFYENRTVAYNVVYEYAGRQYSVQMPQDPGPTVQLQITPVGSAPPPTQQATQPQYQQAAPQPQAHVEPAYIGAPPVVYSGTTYYPYTPRADYAPIGLSLNFGFGSGYRHGGHRHGGHWR